MTPAAHLARAMLAARAAPMPVRRVRASAPAPQHVANPPSAPEITAAPLWCTPSVIEVDLPLRDLLRVVAAAHNDVTAADLRGPSRARHVVLARQEFFWRAARGRMSYSQIAAFLNRDHTTALHGIGQHCRRHNLPMPRHGADLPAFVEQRLAGDKARRCRRADRLTMEQSP